MAVQLQKDRIYKLIIGDGKTGNGIEITDLQITFDISKTSDNKKRANTAAIEVYNLSRESLKILETDFLNIAFDVGYKSIGLKRLLSGQVVEFKTAKGNGGDVVTQLLLGEGYVDLNHIALNITIPKGKTYKDAIEELRKQMPGIDRGIFSGVNCNNQVLYGYPLTGTPRQALNEICAANQMEWRIDNNTLYVTDEAGVIYKGNNVAYVLNKESGLVEIPYYSSPRGKKDKGDKTRRDGIQFKALLNVDIRPGEIVKVESELITGYYKVVDARYTGDFRGQDWYVEAYCTFIQSEDYAE